MNLTPDEARTALQVTQQGRERAWEVHERERHSRQRTGLWVLMVLLVAASFAAGDLPWWRDTAQFLVDLLILGLAIGMQRSRRLASRTGESVRLRRRPDARERAVLLGVVLVSVVAVDQASRYADRSTVPHVHLVLAAGVAGLLLVVRAVARWRRSTREQWLETDWWTR